MGRLLPGMTARVVDPETLEPREATQAGLLWLRGPNVFAGYLDRPDLTASALRDGWFVTGDLGRIDEDGFLHIEGRLSRFSKLGGEMVPHGTVEQRVVAAFGLEGAEGTTVFVCGVPDAAKGEQLVLLTTRDEVTADALRERLPAQGVPNLWIPRVVRRVEAIPVLGTGKLDLKAATAMAREAVK